MTSCRIPFGDIGTSSPPISSTRSSSSITPAATIASTSATVKRRRGKPSAAEVTRAADPMAPMLLSERAAALRSADLTSLSYQGKSVAAADPARSWPQGVGHAAIVSDHFEGGLSRLYLASPICSPIDANIASVNWSLRSRTSASAHRA